MESDKCINVWITGLSGGYAGYGTFPNTSVTAEQGVVTYTNFARTSSSAYNRGDTLTHELGHF